MPFDGTEHEGLIEVLEKMDRVIGLLSNERRWCKGVLYTHEGRRCIVGAMMLADAVIELKKPILRRSSKLPAATMPGSRRSTTNRRQHTPL